jgi:hypothetical protein
LVFGSKLRRGLGAHVGGSLPGDEGVVDRHKTNFSTRK